MESKIEVRSPLRIYLFLALYGAFNLFVFIPAAYVSYGGEYRSQIPLLGHLSLLVGLLLLLYFVYYMACLFIWRPAKHFEFGEDGLHFPTYIIGNSSPLPKNFRPAFGRIYIPYTHIEFFEVHTDKSLPNLYWNRFNYFMLHIRHPLKDQVLRIIIPKYFSRAGSRS